MRRDESLLQDLALACQDILDFIEGMEAAQFYGDIKTQAAVQQRFMILGEATKRLSMEFRETHPQIQWKSVAGMRDRLIHGYGEVDLSIVWQAATARVPALLGDLRLLIPTDTH